MYHTWVAWFDINGDVKVYFEGLNKTCTEVSNSLSHKCEDSGGFCSAAKTKYFQECCFQKCEIYLGAQFDPPQTLKFHITHLL